MSEESKAGVQGEKAHHLLGGSVAPNWLNCAGWAGLVAKYADQEPEEESEAAKAGTVLHYGILERKVPAELRARLEGVDVPDDLYSDIEGWPEDGEQWADAFWEALWTGPLEEIITGKNVFLEKKLMWAPEVGGTADVVIVYRDDKGKVVLIVGDLKTGYIKIPPDYEQLLFYLCAANKLLEQKGTKVEVFKTFVFQPDRVGNDLIFGNAYKEAKFTPAKVRTISKRIDKALVDLKKAKPKFKVGKWCTYCKVKAVCSTFNNDIEKRMDLVEVGDKPLPMVEGLDDQTIVKWLKYSDIIEDYIQSVRKYALGQLVSGREIEGLKLVQGSSRRRWADEEDAARVLELSGVDPWSKKIIGIGEAEKILKVLGKDKREIAYLMERITEKPEGKLSVAVDEDSRPAIAVELPGSLLGSVEEEVEVVTIETTGTTVTRDEDTEITESWNLVEPLGALMLID